MCAADDTGRHHRCAVFRQMNRTSIRIWYTRREIGALQATKEQRRRTEEKNSIKMWIKIQIDQMAIEQQRTERSQCSLGWVEVGFGRMHAIACVCCVWARLRYYEMQNIDRCASSSQRILRILRRRRIPTSAATIRLYSIQHLNEFCVHSSHRRRRTGSFIVRENMPEKILMIISNQTNEKKIKIKRTAMFEMAAAHRCSWLGKASEAPNTECVLQCVVISVELFSGIVCTWFALRRKPISYVRLSIASRWQLTRPIGIVPS